VRISPTGKEDDLDAQDLVGGELIVVTEMLYATQLIYSVQLQDDRC